GFTNKPSFTTSMVTFEPFLRRAIFPKGRVILKPKLFPQGWMVVANFAGSAMMMNSAAGLWLAGLYIRRSNGVNAAAVCSAPP
ncbi:MAG: hypothetical protein KGQ62_09065, partial [Gammaproteobacteria bacterium]|nr:hypothetical protein [Gammaproteobacteria bacterium]MDE1983566.1 hypothetical protein [Gammaproteobacteria bacterium]